MENETRLMRFVIHSFNAAPQKFLLFVVATCHCFASHFHLDGECGFGRVHAFVVTRKEKLSIMLHRNFAVHIHRLKHGIDRVISLQHVLKRLGPILHGTVAHASGAPCPSIQDAKGLGHVFLKKKVQTKKPRKGKHNNKQSEASFSDASHTTTLFTFDF
jgi:hypothetical protein